MKLEDVAVLVLDWNSMKCELVSGYSGLKAVQDSSLDMGDGDGHFGCSDPGSSLDLVREPDTSACQS